MVAAQRFLLLALVVSTFLVNIYCLSFGIDKNGLGSPFYLSALKSDLTHRAKRDYSGERYRTVYYGGGYGGGFDYRPFLTAMLWKSLLEPAAAPATPPTTAKP